MVQRLPSSISRRVDEAKSETSSLLADYGVPLLLTTDAGFFGGTSGDEIVAGVQGRSMACAWLGYARSQVPQLRGDCLELHVSSVPWDVFVPKGRRR